MKSVSDITAFLNHSIAHTHTFQYVPMRCLCHPHNSCISGLSFCQHRICGCVVQVNYVCVERDTCFMLYCHTENVRARKSLKSDSSSCTDSGWGLRPLTLELSKLSSPPQTQNAEHKPAIYTEKETLAQQLCRASSRQWLLKGTYYRNSAAKLVCYYINIASKLLLKYIWLI